MAEEDSPKAAATVAKLTRPGGTSRARTGGGQNTSGGLAAPAPLSGGRGAGGVVAGGGDSGGAGGAGAEVSDAFNHHAIRDIKRGEGQSSVKTAAYITGESLADERLGLSFGRSEKSGRVLDVGTVGPKGQAWSTGDLWSAAEKAETRSNARVAQERTLAIPAELDDAASARLLNGYALWHRDTYGTAATWALHAPGPQGDQRNKHGHILTTTRRVEMGADGRPVFGEKVRALSGNRETVRAETERQRAEWAKRVNAELERAGSPRRLDHRSYKRRAETGDAPPDLEPGQHKGAKRSAQERRGGGEGAKRRDAARKSRNLSLWRLYKEEKSFWAGKRQEAAAERRQARYNATAAAANAGGLGTHEDFDPEAWAAGSAGGGGGGPRLTDAIQRAARAEEREDAREAAAAARWAAKQRREWERWARRERAAQEREERER